MDIKNLDKAAELEEFAGYVADLSKSLDHDHGHGGDGSIETLREDEYEGHLIQIRTTYKIEVDGATLMAPLGLDNQGNLHCHALPNYQFTSAIEMVRRLIDNFPDDFKRKRASKKQSGKAATKKSPSKPGHGSHKHSMKGGK